MGVLVSVVIVNYNSREFLSHAVRAALASTVPIELIVVDNCSPDGSEQAGSRRVVPTPWRSMVRVLHLDRLFPNHPRFSSFCRVREPLPTKPVFTEAISGAFMLARRAALAQAGLLDKRYFLHCE